MSKDNTFSGRWPFVFGTLLGAICWASPMRAQDFYYDTEASSPAPWLGTSWSASPSGPYTSAWVDGNKAIFNFDSSTTVQLVGGNVQAAGIASQGASDLTLSGDSSGRRTINFLAGSEVSSISTADSIEFTNYLDVTGNFTVTSGQVTFVTTSGASNMTFSGTATVQAGARIQINGGVNSTWTNANFVVDGGSFRTGGGGPTSLGGLTINDGVFDMGAGGAANYSLTITALSGAGGLLTVRPGVGASIHTLTVNQATNTAFSGTLQGVNGTRSLTLIKAGSGTLTLDGAVINLQQGTTINEGTLLVSGEGARTFDNLSSENAITVASGGVFGGDSILTISGGENVVVQEGGALIAGAGLAATGTTAFTFESGGNLDLSQVSSASDWLHFDLGATSDQILVSGGTLALGSGLLEFDDFSFNTLAGFGAGTYTLFAADAHSGSLGSLLSGAVGEGYTGTLSLNGSDVVLNVSVPEPQTAALAVIGLAFALGLSRARPLLNRS